MIDPGKLADAAAMHERAARDRLAFKSSSCTVPDGPMAAATRAQVDAALDEIRDAFIAGARLASAEIEALQARLDEAEDEREYLLGERAEMAERWAADR